LGNQSVFANSALADAAANGDMGSIKTLLGQGIAVDSVLVDGSTALHSAVMQNRMEVIRALLKAGASSTAVNRYGVTPLYLAALNGNAEIAAELIKAGSDPNALTPTGETILMIAARTGTPEVLDLLLDAGADLEAREAEFSQTALMLAVRENNIDAISLLIERGAEVNVFTRIGEAPAFVKPCKGTGCGSEGVGINRGGLPDRGRRDSAKGGMTPLLYAARDGHAETAELLIAAGANVEQAEANAIRPLLMALLNNQLDVANQLLDAGASVNVDDFWGRTPLFAAVEYRNLDMNNKLQDAPTHNNVDREAVLPMIKRLLDAGADVNARTREVPPSRKWLYSLNDVSWVDFTGETAFLRAAYSGDTTTMKMLLEYGADPNLATFAGTTPLMAAAGVNWVVAQTYTESMEALIAAIRICLEHGADVNATNSMGLTALLGAVNKGANDIIRVLVDEGARLDVVDAQGRDAHRWAEGVFLAAVGAELKPHTIALLDELIAAEQARATRDSN
jgi:ankyrin repeat protein